MPTLSGSVGKNGANRNPDMATIQTLLQRGTDPGPMNGLCGPSTIAAIMQFQKEFMHHPDGLIDVNGTT